MQQHRFNNKESNFNPQTGTTKSALRQYTKGYIINEESNWHKKKFQKPNAPARGDG